MATTHRILIAKRPSNKSEHRCSATTDEHQIFDEFGQKCGWIGNVDPNLTSPQDS